MGATYASDKLERSRGDFGAGWSNTDDDGLTPTFVTGLEGSSHDLNIACAVKSIVTSTIGHLDQLLLDRLALQFSGVDEIGTTKLFRPFLLLVVGVDHDDLARAVLNGTLDDRETDAARAEDSNIRVLFDIGGDDGSAITGGDTAAEQTGLVHVSLVRDRHHGNIGDHGILGESRCAHEVK